MSDIIDTLGTRQDFQVQSGATFGGFIFQNLINGVAADITGATIEMTLRLNSRTNENAAITLTTEDSSITFVDASDGKGQVEPFNFPAGENTYYYDIKTTYADGKIRRHNYGIFYAEEKVT